MIEILQGHHETIRYGGTLGLKLYHNYEYEDYPEHWHSGLEIIMPVKAGYTVCADDKVFQLKEQEICIINSGVIHSLRAPQVGERIILQFEAALLHTIKEMETLLFKLPPVYHITAERKEQYAFIRAKMEALIKEHDGDNLFREASVYATLIEIFVRIGRDITLYQEENRNEAAHKTNQREYLEAVMNACDFINQHLLENITLERVAAVGGFSKYHFSRVFKLYMDITFYDYLNMKRVNKAKELLAYSSHMSITDVAMNAGFSSLSSFNRNFKALNQCSPSEYRSKLGEDIMAR